MGIEMGKSSIYFGGSCGIFQQVWRLLIHPPRFFTTSWLANTAGYGGFHCFLNGDDPTLQGGFKYNHQPILIFLILWLDASGCYRSQRSRKIWHIHVFYKFWHVLRSSEQIKHRSQIKFWTWTALGNGRLRVSESIWAQNLPGQFRCLVLCWLWPYSTVSSQQLRGLVSAMLH